MSAAPGAPNTPDRAPAAEAPGATEARESAASAHEPKPRPAYPWWMEVAAWLGVALIQLLARSWRLDRSGFGEHDARLDQGERCIFAFWHARLLPLVFTHRARGVALLISRHRDGELITRIIERMGYVTARGSSTRGGEEGLREMLEWAQRGHMLGITPDGPRGPAERLKPGLLYLASRSGFAILPVASASDRYWRLRSWDGFRIPQPFARVVAAYGEPILIPAGLDREALELRAAEVEAAITRLTAEVERRASGAA